MRRPAFIPWHRRFEARVVVSVAAIAGLSLAAVLVATSRVVTAASSDRATADLVAGRQAFDRLVANRTAFVVRQTRLIAELPIFKSALTDPRAAADGPTMNGVAGDYCGKLDAQLCVVTDASGRWAGSAHVVSEQAIRDVLAPAIATARVGRSSSQVVTADQGLFLIVAEPAMFAEEVLGTFTAGYRLDDSVARELALLTHCEVTFLCGPLSVCGSSLPAAARSGLVMALVGSPGAAPAAPPDVPALRRISDAAYMAGTYPLAGSGSAARLILLRSWLPTERALADLHTALYWVGGLTFGIAIAGTLMFSRRATRPLGQLVAAANQIASGDWTRRVALEGPPEARALAEAFNHMTDAIRQREDRLRHAQKMEAVGRLAGGIAHDFNNLLTAILGYANLMLDELPAGHPVRDDVKGIQKAGRSAAALTRDLLAFSRRQALQPVVVDLGAVIRECESLIRRLVGEAVTLTLGVVDGCWVKVDRAQMEQVLLNLSANARDAMPSGGRLAIATRLVDNRRGEIAGERRVEMTVTDTGEGMTDEVRSQIFEPFFTTKAHGKGTGLGLATVYGIVQQSGGRIDVTSAPGAGSTFTLTLPAVEPPAMALEVDDADQAEERGVETVLLVEDNESVRHLARAALSRRGYTVIEASNGQEALSVAAAHPHIDVLVTDVVMPLMGGHELATRLMASRDGLKVIFTSGYTDVETVQQHPAAKTFVPKPFTPASLGRALRSVLDADDRGSLAS